MGRQNDSVNEGNLFSINVRMIPSKIGQFLTGCCQGSFTSYLNVFFISTGITQFKAGVLTALMYTSCAIAGPVWGYLADYTGRRRLILVVLCVGAALTMFSIPWTARSIYPPSKYICNGKRSNISSDMQIFTGTKVNQTETCKESQRKLREILFWGFVAIILVASAFVLIVYSYLDAIIINVVKNDKQGATYGPQKLFGVIGGSFSAYFSGKLCEYYHVEDMSDYSPVFFLFALYSTLLVPTGLYLMTQINYDTTGKDNNEKCNDHIKGGYEVKKKLYQMVIQTCVKLDTVLFFITVFVAGMANAISLNFPFKFLMDKLHRKKGETSVVLVTGPLGCLIILPYASKLIKCFKGSRMAINFCLFIYFIKFLVMSYDIPFELFVAVQVFDGFGFGLGYSAMMEKVFIISTKQIQVTMTLIMTTIYFQVSAFVAIICGSYIYEMYGGEKMFFGTCICCCVWSTLMTVYHIRRRKGDSSTDENEKEEAHLACEDTGNRSSETSTDIELHEKEIR